MRTSASCPRDHRRHASGFTLLELLVVMAVVGLLAAMVAPNLERLFGSVDRSLRRDRLAAEVAGLGYRAYAIGQSFELNNTDQGRLLKDGNPLLAVPRGWRVEVPHPIQFGFNGWCSGGDVDLVSPDGVVERMRLRAPDCREQRA